MKLTAFLLMWFTTHLLYTEAFKTRNHRRSLFANFFNLFVEDENVIDMRPKKKMSPRRKTPANDANTVKQNYSYVPISLLTKLRKVKSMEDFISTFNVKGTHVNGFHGKEEKHLKLTFEESLDGDTTSTDSTNAKAMSFECHPRPQLTEISDDYTATFWPPCIYIKQCGGCCFHPRNMECVPSRLHNKSTEVYKIPLTSGIPVLHTVHMLEHAACKCRCRVQPKDCLPTQNYDASNCQCDCNKTKQNCLLGKQWSHRKCKCECSIVRNCGRKFYWNDNTCRCECARKRCRKYFELDPTTCRCVYMGLIRNQ